MSSEPRLPDPRVQVIIHRDAGFGLGEVVKGGVFFLIKHGFSYGLVDLPIINGDLPTVNGDFSS